MQVPIIFFSVTVISHFGLDFATVLKKQKREVSTIVRGLSTLYATLARY